MTHYLGIDIGGTNVKAAVIAEDGGVKASEQRRWSGGDAPELVSAAAELADIVVGEIDEYSVDRDVAGEPYRSRPAQRRVVSDPYQPVGPGRFQPIPPRRRRWQYFLELHHQIFRINLIQTLISSKVIKPVSV